MADLAYGRCVKCRHLAPLPADACPRCGKAIEPLAPAPSVPPGAASTSPHAPAVAAPSMARSAGRPAGRTFLFAALAVGGVLAAILVAALLAGPNEPPVTDMQVQTAARFFLQGWDAPDTARVDAPFRVTLTLAEDTSRPALSQQLALELDGVVIGREQVEPGEGAPRQVIMFARITEPGAHTLTVRLNGEQVAQRTIVAR